jgi:hypothetical protein
LKCVRNEFSRILYHCFVAVFWLRSNPEEVFCSPDVRFLGSAKNILYIRSKRTVSSYGNQGGVIWRTRKVFATLKNFSRTPVGFNASAILGHWLLRCLGIGAVSPYARIMEFFIFFYEKICLKSSVRALKMTPQITLKRRAMGSIQFSQSPSWVVPIERSCFFFIPISRRTALLMRSPSRNRRERRWRSAVNRDFRP